MPEVDIAALTASVLWASFALAVAFGAVAQRTHFCTMGAVGDIVNMGDWSRMRMWALAIGVTTVGFNLMAATGVIDSSRTFYAPARLPWLALALGGLLFGVGMVLASGCGSKTLVRIGGGNLKSIVVFLAMAITALATMRGLTAVWRQRFIDPVAIGFSTPSDLPSLIAHASGAPRSSLVLGLGIGIGLMLCLWAVWNSQGRSRDNLLGGVGIGLCATALWWVSGSLGFVAEHPDTLESVIVGTNSRGMESFTFVGPAAYALDWFTYASDRSKVLTLAVVIVPGVVLGAALMARLEGSFRWEGFRGTEDVVNHLVGGALMGVGGVMALGCTIGQGLSGISTLALGSFIALAFILAGAVLGLRYQIWRIERMA